MADLSPKVSIVIPVFNQLHFTKQCLETLAADAKRPSCEVIVVNNGSSDGTREYLDSVELNLASSSPFKLAPIHNEKNLGVSPAWNQGLRKSRGEFIAILNNDLYLTQGWCSSLIEAFPQNGAALLSPYAQTGALDYDIATRAEIFTRKNKNAFWPDYDFCAVIMPRATFERIGFFDEDFQVGGYEDTDYAYRLEKAGMRFGVSGAAFIHHFGSQTLGEFKRLGDKHVDGNRKHFIEKWGEDPSRRDTCIRARVRRRWRKIKIHFDLM